MPRYLSTLCLFLACAGVHADPRQDIVRMGGDVRVEPGMAVTSAVAIGGSVTVEGRVEEDVVAIGGSVTLGPKAEVRGNAVAIGGRVDLAPGATVAGDLTEVGLPWGGRGDGWGDWGWRLTLLSSLGFLALGLIFAALFPGVLEDLAGQAQEAPGRTFLWGAFGTLALPPLILLLVLSLVGIFLVPLTLVSATAAFVAGYIAMAALVGERVRRALRRPAGSRFLDVLAGLVLLTAVGWIPFLGWLVKFTAALFGFGASLRYLGAAIRRSRARRSGLGTGPIPRPSPA